MKLFDQIRHFDFLTASEAMPMQQLYLYYFILFLIYLLFLRGLKPTYLTATMFLMVNQGFFESLLGRPGIVGVKIGLVILIIILLIKSRPTNLTNREMVVLWGFVAFSILIYLGYILNGVSVVWASYQYYKYAFPVAMYFIIKGLHLSEKQFEYYTDLLFKLLIFQVIFSVVKILVIGFRENITGSIANTGGGIGIGYAVMGTITYWVVKKGDLSAKDWRFVFMLLVIPAASTKRAIWFLFPIIVVMLMGEKLSKNFMRNAATLLLVAPLLIYVGFRLNPSLNPEKKLWGSFDPQYAIDYALSYSGVSEEKLEGDYAQGRWGSSVAIVKETVADPFTKESLIGFARSRSGSFSEDFRPEDYGFMPGTMVSKIGGMIIQMGWLATLLIIFIFLLLIYSIPDRRIAHIIAFYVLWDTMLYSGSMINSPYQSVLLIYCIWIIKYQIEKHQKQGIPMKHEMIADRKLMMSQVDSFDPIHS